MCLFFERLDKCAIFYASNGEARATSQHMTQVDYHTGFAMHTYHRDAPGISDEEYAKYKYPGPREQVEPREEGSRDEDVVPHWVPWGEKRLGEETGGFLKSGR